MKTTMKEGFGARSRDQAVLRICVDLLEALKRERTIEFKSRTAVLSLSHDDWIYLHNPRVDGDAERTASQMAHFPEGNLRIKPGKADITRRGRGIN